MIHCCFVQQWAADKLPLNDCLLFGETLQTIGWGIDLSRFTFAHDAFAFWKIGLSIFARDWVANLRTHWRTKPQCT